MHVGVGELCGRVSRGAHESSEEGTRFPGAGNTGGCEMPDCVARIKSRSSARTVNALNSCGIAPAWALILNITYTQPIDTKQK